ncbi:hypothetical protein Mal33_49470 [Rosistilla oblonga]|uniref:Thiol reductase thioredoxin n=2 Tax=Rosistilla oblonga TaxID=2527990 RepID=A0A518J0R7_9BACT|nr:hypothetical protein Mal33_49470 [Rosistilla oblonga]
MVALATAHRALWKLKSKMIPASYFHQGLPYDDFLAKHGSDLDRRKWAAVYDVCELSDAQTALIGGFVREMRVLCFAGAWCGDCVQQCPILRRIEQASDKITVRYIDRDASDELKGIMSICGAARVPQVAFFSEEDFFVGHYGDRTLARYRQMADQLAGAACGSGIVTADDPVQAAVIQEWINEFERPQLMLRTSARLREKHGD